MSLSIHLPPELKARLRQRAAAEGKDPAVLALEVVRERVDRDSDTAVNAPVPRQRLEAWDRFTAHMKEHAEALPADHVLDDSRESIYEGSGE